MATDVEPLLPHRNDNIRKVDVNVNTQTKRKPSELNRQLYWDYQGLHEGTYAKRLGGLPAVGCADSLGDEIFRAAANVLQCGESDTDIYSVIYPYSIGATIILEDEHVLTSTIETMMDRTLEFLIANPALDKTPNCGLNFNDLRDHEQRSAAERVEIRNRFAKRFFLADKENTEAQDPVTAFVDKGKTKKKKKKLREKRKGKFGRTNLTAKLQSMVVNG
ncbi:hypothetical protein THAOC_21110 [Thalassiosira oceanica]|uniref:Uncharacterized protein n=1 Tax=Thalassiosira oceanica TaxID=159749 RepID=K0S0C5_THAOC|nr:hypothetical protein THAOC_21110 [Thalassiosira oceanica]|eukprot:EJK58735.1 hypothetical protein THAOC_21110 [Thalassiosira oceanica]